MAFFFSLLSSLHAFRVFNFIEIRLVVCYAQIICFFFPGVVNNDCTNRFTCFIQIEASFSNFYSQKLYVQWMRKSFVCCFCRFFFLFKQIFLYFLHNYELAWGAIGDNYRPYWHNIYTQRRWQTYFDCISVRAKYLFSFFFSFLVCFIH